MSLLARHATATDGEPVSAAPIPAVVSAAWELELIIAGAVTFALFQLPGSLDAARAWLDARAPGVPQVVIAMGFVYAKATVYVLLGAFLLNLVARAYWVGLVGLHSVFPHGINWEQPRIGPAARDVYRERLASLPAVIARVDNFASIIFSFAFLVVVIVLFSVTSVTIFGSMSWALNTFVLHGRGRTVAFWSVGLVLMLPLATLGIVDKVLGPRWPAESVAGRRLRRLTRIAMRLNGTAAFGPIFLTLFTNLRRGVMMTVFYLVFIGSLTIAMAELFVRLNVVAGGTPRYVPEDPEIGGVSPGFYESLRTPDGPTTVPTIQSDVVEGPYLRLFIPYLIARHEPAIAARCPAARPQRTTRLHFSFGPTDVPAAEQSAQAVLSCLAGMHAVTLDGAPLPDLALRFYRHPVTGQPGMLAHLPTSGIATGAHVLRVLPPPRAPDSNNRRPLTPYVIPFWK